MRVIFIPGIATTKQVVQKTWKKEFKRRFSDVDLVVIEKTYMYTQHKTIVALRDKVVDLLNDGQPTVLVGHSFGGLVAVAAAVNTNKKASIVGMLTMASPHSLQAPGLEDAREVLGYRYVETNFPVHTFGAFYDHLVHRAYTKYPGSQHKNIHCAHPEFVLAASTKRQESVWQVIKTLTN